VEMILKTIKRKMMIIEQSI